MLTLGLCSAFIMASCSDDAVEPQKVDVEDEVHDDMLYSDESLINYIMSQFAELDENGNLIERTTYFRQLNESDTTAIYTIADSKTAARAKFLSLLPESYQTKVIVRNDSAQMSLPIGTTPLQISYKEGSTDDNVVATVQLPSQGAYTKIANTLTMVKSLGQNYDAAWDKYICRFEQIKFKVLTCDSPVPLDQMYYPQLKLYVEEVPLHMLCYNVTDEGVAQYIFIPPLTSGKKQLRLKSGNYLVGFFYPWMLQTAFVTDDLEANVKKIKDVLPSPMMLNRMVTGLTYFGSKNQETGARQDVLERNYSKWFDESYFMACTSGDYPEDFARLDNETQEETIMYFSTMQNFLSGTVRMTSEIELLVGMSNSFPYQIGDFMNYQSYPEIPWYVENRLAKQPDQPFFIKGEKWLSTSDMDADEVAAVYRRALSLATNQVYGRDKDNVAHVIDVYISELHGGDWEVYDFVKEGTTFQSFFYPYQGSAKWDYAKKGRNIALHNGYPLRIFYLYEKKLQ